MSVYSTDCGFVETTDEQLGAGGRGRVVPLECFYDPTISLSADDLVCKLVDPRFRSEGRQRKTALLIEMGKGDATPVTASLATPATQAAAYAKAVGGLAGVRAAWPVSNLFEDGEWVGYLMPKVRGVSLSEARADSHLPFQKKVQLVRRWCEMIDVLHARGVVVGDLSLANCLYDACDDELGLIDLDSMQLVDAVTRHLYPTVESREKSPEMLAGTLGEVVLSSRSDDYLMAIEVFRMLFDAHPLDEYRKDVSPAKVRSENARNRRFAYELNGEGCGVDIFGSRLAELFRRSFGGEYERIPAVRDYASALRELETAQLAGCDCCGRDHALLPGEGALAGIAYRGRGIGRRARSVAAGLACVTSSRKAKRAALLGAAACGACLFMPEIASATTGLLTEAQEWFAQASAWVDQLTSNAGAALESADAAISEAGAALESADLAIDQALDSADAALDAALDAAGAWLSSATDALVEEGGALFAWMGETFDAALAWFDQL